MTDATDRTLLVLPGGYGLPSMSSFSTKAMLLLKEAGLEARIAVGDTRKAPKGKLPVLIDGDRTIADTAFIRRHIETVYGHDFDAGLDAKARARSYAFATLADERLYWLGAYERWLIPANADMVKRSFEGMIPKPVAPLIFAVIRRSIRKAMHGQGLGRHTPDELAWIGERTLEAIEVELDGKPYLTGETPKSVDLSVAPCLDSLLLPPTVGFMKPLLEARPGLVAYAERMRARYDLKTVRAGA